MTDKEVTAQVLDWAERLLLRSWIQGILLDRSPFADEWREMVEKQEILSAPLMRAQFASIRAGILESPVETARFQDWDEEGERLIRSANDLDFEE